METLVLYRERKEAVIDKLSESEVLNEGRFLTITKKLGGPYVAIKY